MNIVLDCIINYLENFLLSSSSSLATRKTVLFNIFCITNLILITVELQLSVRALSGRPIFRGSGHELACERWEHRADVRLGKSTIYVFSMYVHSYYFRQLSAD